MIYGATGYTGRLACEYAKQTGLDFVLAGRDASKVEAYAALLDVECVIFNLDDATHIDMEIEHISVLLNCAGPFAKTAQPLMDACIRSGVHYLDTSAELNSYHQALHKHDTAVKAGVMLMPGCGGSVAMLGCLTSQVIKDVERPSSVDIALHVSGAMSRGSSITAASSVTTGLLQRRHGEVVAQQETSTRSFDFADGRGPVTCFPVTMPDLVTIWKSTGVNNIRAFVNASGEAFPSGDLDELPDGPSIKEREANPYHAAVAITAADGTVKFGALETLNGYNVTSVGAVEAVRQVLAGTTQPGFQTPVGVYGPSFMDCMRSSKMQRLTEKQ